MSRQITKDAGREELFEMSVKKMEKRMAEEKGLIPNVDFIVRVFITVWKYLMIYSRQSLL